MRECYRGSVNRWECDENDHLNVRWFMEKHWQTLTAGLLDLGIVDSERVGDLLQQVQVQHIRYLAEARLSTPMSGFIGVVSQDEDGVGLLTELRHGTSGSVLSSVVHLVTGLTGLAVDAELPSHAAPKGVAAADHPYVGCSMTQAEALGFRPIGLGAIQDYETSSSGLLFLHHYMGRLSDVMPHLWGGLGLEDAHSVGREGGAVLEYRLRIHRPLRAGDGVRVLSGLAEVGAKVQQFCHLLYDRDEVLCLSAAAATVRMDLATRRAIRHDADRIAHMQTLALKPPPSA